MIFTNDKSIFSEKEEKFEIRGKIEIKTEPSIKTELIRYQIQDRITKLSRLQKGLRRQ